MAPASTGQVLWRAISPDLDITDLSSNHALIFNCREKIDQIQSALNLRPFVHSKYGIHFLFLPWFCFVLCGTLLSLRYIEINVPSDFPAEISLGTKSPKPIVVMVMKQK
uniref:Uncharacterized protein n=1 Tax=Glossina palpalis gambiensis TaxID=67801 RepID=A0A1B0APG5_9MUSC